MPAPPRYRSSSPSTRSTFPTRIIDRVKSELAAEGLQPEDWGGTTQFSEVSAKQKQNLTTCSRRCCSSPTPSSSCAPTPSAEASGPIIESRLDVGRGPVATLLVHRGTLHVGDAIVAGDACGPRPRPLRLPRREGQGGAAGRAGRDRRLRYARRPLARSPRRRERAPGAPSRPARARSGLRREQLAQRAKPISLEACSSGWRRVGASRTSTSWSRPMSRAPSRRPSARCKRSSTPRCASSVIHSAVGRHHGERRHARRGVRRDDRRLQRPPERGSAGARRARGRRDPDVPRHLPADRGHREGSRRHAASPSARRWRSARPRCAP